MDWVGSDNPFDTYRVLRVYMVGPGEKEGLYQSEDRLKKISNVEPVPMEMVVVETWVL